MPQSVLAAFDPQDQEAAESFIEQMGMSAESDGLPRIAGRMWGFFIIHGGPCSFAELAQRLQVSRGSVSTNARILRDLGILQRVALPGDRQDYYELSERPYDKLLHGYVQRMKRMHENADKASAGIAASQLATQQRLAELRRFYHSAVVATEELINTLQETQAE